MSIEHIESPKHGAWSSTWMAEDGDPFMQLFCQCRQIPIPIPKSSTWTSCANVWKQIPTAWLDKCVAMYPGYRGCTALGWQGFEPLGMNPALFTAGFDRDMGIKTNYCTDVRFYLCLRWFQKKGLHWLPTHDLLTKSPSPNMWHSPRDIIHSYIASPQGSKQQSNIIHHSPGTRWVPGSDLGLRLGSGSFSLPPVARGPGPCVLRSHPQGSPGDNRVLQDQHALDMITKLDKDWIINKNYKNQQ